MRAIPFPVRGIKSLSRGRTRSHSFPGHRCRPWKIAMISSRSSRTRYGITYGVPCTTSSRVPGVRPALPTPGCAASRSTL